MHKTTFVKKNISLSERYFFLILNHKTQQREKRLFDTLHFPNPEMHDTMILLKISVPNWANVILHVLHTYVVVLITY